MKLTELAEPAVGTLSRPLVSARTVEFAVLETTNKIARRLAKKGYGAFAGKHEISGILDEEFDELRDAIRDDAGGIEPVAQELLDIAVGAIFGLACIRSGAIK